MAGSTVTLAKVDDILLDEYPFNDKIWKQFDEGAPILDLIDSGQLVPFLGRHEGRQIRIPMHTAGNPIAAVPVSEEGQLPSPGHQTYAEAIFNLATHAQALRMTGLSMITASGGSRSVADALTLEMANQPKNARKRMAQLMHADGSGLYAKVGATQTAASAADAIVVASVTNLKVGQEVVIRQMSNGDLWVPVGGVGYTLSTTGALKIATITAATNLVTFTDEDGNVTFDLDADNAVTPENFALYPYDSIGEAVNGLEIICDSANPTTWGGSGNFGDIDRGSTAGAFWKAQQINADDTGTTTFNIQDHIQPMHDKLDEFAEELAQTWMAFLRYDNWNLLGNQMTRDQRTEGGQRKALKGGWEGLEYGPTMFVRDKDAPASEVRWIAPSTVYRYIANQWYWDTMTGSMWEIVKSTAGRANRNTRVYRTTMFTDQQTLCAQCVSNGRLINLDSTN